MSILIKEAVSRKSGCLYFINLNGDLVEARTKINIREDGTKEKPNSKIFIKDCIKREKGIVYYIDSLGNVCQKKLKVLEEEQKKRAESRIDVFKIPENVEWIKKRLEVDWGEANRLRDLAFIHINEGKLNQAEKELNLAIVEAKDLGGGVLYDMLGDIYQKKGENRNALFYYNKSLRISGAAKKRDKINKIIKLMKGGC
jgi:tetratricopeptide (TPR) repeat protein